MAIVGHRVTGFFLPGRFDVHLLPGDASPDLFGGLDVRPGPGPRRPRPGSRQCQRRRRNDRARCGWTCTTRAIEHLRRHPRQWSRRAACARRHVRSLDARCDRRQPTSCRYPHPELPREGDRDGEKRCGANHCRSVGSRARARASRAHLAHAEPDDHPPRQCSPTALRAVRGVRRRRRHRHHAERRADPGVGRTGHLDERSRRDRHREPEIRFDLRASARERAHHRIVPASGRWSPDHRYRDGARRPAVERGRRSHVGERRRRAVVGTCPTSCSSARASRTPPPIATPSTAS